MPKIWELYKADMIVFLAFVAAVVTVGLLKSRKGKTSEDYFLAGRGLSWWLIGFSLIAANISTEQFVGMSGNAASHAGLAIASYEWIAAITLVVVAFAFLPYFLRVGIFTMPEFLEYRYNLAARTIMAVATLFIYLILLGSVTYSGALTIRTVAGKMGYDVSLFTGSLAIGLIAMLYVAAGGLRACAWADLIQGSALILGGAVIVYFAFDKLGQVKEATYFVDVQTGAVAAKALAAEAGPIERFRELNSVRLSMYLPAGDPILPWTALLLGIWIPNFYYWGLNQYITQRTLGSKSLAQGQQGIVFAAFLKLIIPFVIVFPGIIAFNLFAKDMQLEAVKDNGPILAKYYKANPKTAFVEVRKAPDEETIRLWKPGRYLIALYPDEKTISKIKTLNPYVLPLTEKKFNELEVEKFTVFESEDKAWNSKNPGLAAEIKEYNKRVQKLAEREGARVRKEKPIVYKYDTALGQLFSEVLPQGRGLLGFVMAALLGAVVSSLAAMLNAASTIFSMDVFKRYIAPKASQGVLVFVGRFCVVLFTGVAVLLAPELGNPNIKNSIFTIIQESQGFISPGILAAFVFGLAVRRGPPVSGVAALITNVICYGSLYLFVPSIQFLDRMAISLGVCLLVMTVITLISPLPEPIEFKQQTDLDLRSSRGAFVAGIVVIMLTVTLYILFSPLVIAKP